MPVTSEENKKTSDTASESAESKAEPVRSKNIKWSPENEIIMVEWCDVAQCYKWLNTRAHAKLSRAHAWFTIPAITLSTITGTASFAQSSLPVSMQVYSPAVIGTINICIGILSTIQQYLKISELNEAHRVSAISWDKFARNIRIELSKDPDERTDAGQFIKICRMEFDRLMETSPAIPQKIVDDFNNTFKGKAGSPERARFEALRKPDICDTITTANEYRHQWYKNMEHLVDDDNDIQKEMDEVIRVRMEEEQSKMIELIRLKREKDEEELVNEHRKSAVERDIKEKASKLQSEIDVLKKYVDDFVENAGRKPHHDELKMSMRNTVSDDALAVFKDIL
jgi:hypothetical protein